MLPLRPPPSGNWAEKNSGEQKYGKQIDTNKNYIYTSMMRHRDVNRGLSSKQ